MSRAFSGLSQDQHSVIVGTLLGDGAMRCKHNALLEINHCAAQQYYVDWKYRYLANLVGTPPKKRQSNGTRVAYRFTTLSLPELTPYYQLFYPHGVKVVPELLLTPLALAVWFMDDGNKTHNSVYLNTQQFKLHDQTTLAAMLCDQFGIRATLNRDKSYFRLRIAVSSISLFLTLIRPHLLSGFVYKVPVGGRELIV